MHKLAARRLLSYLTTASSRHVATASSTTRIGVVGLGNVGITVAKNLTKNGFQLVSAYDINPATMTSLPESCAKATTPREVAETSDVVITNLPRPANVKAASEGPDGVLAGMGPDKVWIDHSTTDYHQTLDYDERVRAVGGHILEAPITGGMGPLTKGQMIVYLGGDKDVSDAMEPILKCSYQTRMHIGPIGSAMIVKVQSNMLCAGNALLAAESLMLAKRSGLDLRTFWDAIRVSVGNSFAWETACPFYFNGSYDTSFTVDLFTKDMQLGMDMAKKFRTPMQCHQHVLSTFRHAQYTYGDHVGCYVPPRLMEEDLAEPLRLEGFDDWEYDNHIEDGSVVVKHRSIKK
ncbi:2-hydroxy-3-oxopropionate reductase-like [Oratosquilla oratoria]|uniref:2-hydroxy-3-oxopropionate reductase-like n=1 Tax=Oratosquilla oratoria TaxID=337810 RepID=UPI003F763E53